MFFFFQAEDGIRDGRVTGVQTCALPILTTIAYVLLGAATVMTVLSGIDYVFKAARLRETSERTRLRREARALRRTPPTQQAQPPTQPTPPTPPTATRPEERTPHRD